MNSNCKSPVLLIFFNRVDTFEKVFAEVRKAKPQIMILAQDGPRNESDKIGIEKCREIAESVDWECKIIKDYAETNLGCGYRPQSAITKALSRFESVIIIEDDCVPSQSFFPYCEELLEKYKNDTRIAYISGINHFEEWDCGDSDYFFAKTGAIAAWATWRRSWLKYYDYYVEGANNQYTRKLLKYQINDSYAYRKRIEAWEKANQSKINGEKLSYWDYQWSYVKYSQNMLVIVPRKNLICNIGVGVDSTHSKAMKTKKYIKYKNFIFIPSHNLEFPLRQMQICIPDSEYDALVNRCTSGSKIKVFIKRIVKLVACKN